MDLLPTLPRRTWLERASLVLAIGLVTLAGVSLAGWLLDSLRELIDRCRAAGAEGTGGFTPSDFPEAGLDQEDLDLLLEQLV